MNVILSHPSPTTPSQSEYLRTVTAKGQVTIPVEVRAAMGVKPNSQVIVRLQAGKVVIEPVAMTLEEAFGSVKPLSRPENFKRLREIALEEKAEQVINRLQP